MIVDPHEIEMRLSTLREHAKLGDTNVTVAAAFLSAVADMIERMRDELYDRRWKDEQVKRRQSLPKPVWNGHEYIGPGA